MKKTIILTALALFATGAYAEDALLYEAARMFPAPKPEMNEERKGPGDFMEQLTEEQKSCVEKELQGCLEFKWKKPEGGLLTEEEKAEMETARECRKKQYSAFETCGVKMPEGRMPDGKMPEGKMRKGGENGPKPPQQ